jgi:hypothetical protein
MLNRYLPHLRTLEAEGFCVTAASHSGIVLSRGLNDDEVSKDPQGGWLGSLFHRSKDRQ